MSKNDDKPNFLDPFYFPRLQPNPAIPYAPWPLKVEILNEVPRYLIVIERIMEKALEHKKAGRVGQFHQVLVPKGDFEALKEYFGEEPWVSTCLGTLPVYPVNPDGATFVD